MISQTENTAVSLGVIRVTRFAVSDRMAVFIGTICIR